MSLETWEVLSYVVTVIGLPLAIAVFLFNERKERANEEEYVYQQVSDNYQDFLKVVLQHPDLRLFSDAGAPDLNDEQRERRLVIFSMLIALFERAYLLLYEESMSVRQARRWKSWEDYMREWCRRKEFRLSLPRLLEGEDPEFMAYIEAVAAEEAGRK